MVEREKRERNVQARTRWSAKSDLREVYIRAIWIHRNPFAADWLVVKRAPSWALT